MEQQQSKAPGLYKKKTGKIWKMSKKDAKMIAERNRNIRNFLSKKPSKAGIKEKEDEVEQRLIALEMEWEDSPDMEKIRRLETAKKNLQRQEEVKNPEKPAKKYWMK